MAIGLGAMFGFKFMENFNYPFISKSVSEYWRRWHISLGTWFKDYLYIPLGGNRGGTWHKYLNIMIVFACVGTWHGATWAFVFSGLYNGAMIVFENIIGMPKAQYGIIGKILQRIYAFIAMLIGLIFFRSETLSYTGNLILNMIGLIEHQNIIYKTSYYFDATAITVMCVAILCATPLFKNILNVDRKHTAVNTMINLWLLVLFGISCIELAANTYNPFIYFRF
jgi:alginate O-acetyltransferase complex protein AlgI